MGHNNRELWGAFAAVVVITLVYLVVMSQIGSIPAASGIFGHGMGIVGFLLMLMTETLYTWRKRSRSARWGRMSSWLRFHIFTGLVGPYMVLLHTSWKFNGLAGIVMLLTVIIVLSGVVGRYIYTAVPRTADGIEIEASELETQIKVVEASLQQWQHSQSEIVSSFSGDIRGNSPTSNQSIGTLLGRIFSDTIYRFNLWRAARDLRSYDRAQGVELESLLKRKRTLQRQVASLVAARRLLSLWHTVHIPIGLALFTTALIHMVGAIYYATLLR